MLVLVWCFFGCRKGRMGRKEVVQDRHGGVWGSDDVVGPWGVNGASPSPHWASLSIPIIPLGRDDVVGPRGGNGAAPSPHWGVMMLWGHGV